MLTGHLTRSWSSLIRHLNWPGQLNWSFQAVLLIDEELVICTGDQPPLGLGRLGEPAQAGENQPGPGRTGSGLDRLGQPARAGDSTGGGGGGGGGGGDEACGGGAAAVDDAAAGGSGGGGGGRVACEGHDSARRRLLSGAF